MTARVSNRLRDEDLVLRSNSSTAVTTTTSETGKLVYPRNHLRYKCVIDVATFDVADTDETYVITVEVSDAEAGTYTVMSTLADATIKAGGDGSNYELPLSSNLACVTDSDSLYVRVTATLGGTSPSINYGAFLAPI
jgi:hypothetical protein